MEYRMQSEKYRFNLDGGGKSQIPTAKILRQIQRSKTLESSLNVSAS